MVGPVPVGVNSFEFEVGLCVAAHTRAHSHLVQASPPASSSIPLSDLLGLTVILLTASYRDQEFVRIGYYVHTEYDSEELRALDPPAPATSTPYRPQPYLKASRNQKGQPPHIDSHPRQAVGHEQ